VHLDADTRAALAVSSADLRAHAAELPVSWVAPENLHITVKFLGRIDETRVPAVIEALHTAATGRHAFDLEIVSLGAFPSPTRPRVLWAGVTEGETPLAALAAAVDDALAPLGFPRETRAFTAHVTLARVREPRRTPALAEALAAAAARRFGRLTIEHVALMRSDLSPRGARYTALSTVPLRR
jgi:2'-5' RNA ligase